MTSIVTRNTVAAIVPESTEGTPVTPTAATQFVPILSDFSSEPAFETLDNEELRASLGSAKPILGAESPATSFSLYLKHSGVEGQAPNYGDLLQAAWGAEDVEGTEYNTIAGSTVSVVKVDVGEGANYRRGQALLVKDGTNGYAIRPVDSISTDDLSIGFDLANAPGTAVDLGKAVTYYPTDTGTPQTLSVWRYAGNGGCIDMSAGNRVVSWAMTAEAGQIISTEYSLEGLEYFFDPIEITSSDTYLDFTDDAGTFAAQISADFYKDPHELASALETAMNALTTETHAVVYSNSTGKFTISTSTSTVFSLLWSSGANAANTVGDKIGFTIADDTGSTSYIADSALDFSNPVGSVSFDDVDPLVAKNNQLFFGDSDDAVCVNASSFSVTLDTPKTDVNSICAASGKSGSVINARTVTATVTALLDQYDAEKFKRFRQNQDTRLMYVGGEKSGGNWVAGKCFCFYMPTCTISTLTPIEDQDGLVGFTAEFTAFVNSDGDGEVYLSFV